MSFIINIFHVIIYQPLYNALIGIYDIIPDLGIAIIILTVIIRVLLIPLSKKSIESQKKMQEIQPEIKKIQEKYKNDKQKQGQVMMEFYKKNKINPASGCLPLIVQLIVLIALYRVFMVGVGMVNGDGLLYSFVPQPESINHIAFGFLDITAKSIPLAIISAGLQYWQTKMMMAKNKKPESEARKKEGEPDFSAIMQKQMLYMGPIITLFIGFQFPAALPLYWMVTTLFMIGQQYFIFNKDKEKEPKQLQQGN